MRITVIGAGAIGSTLGRAWVQAGHTVQFGLRRPYSPEAQALAQELGPAASVTSIADSLTGGNVIVFAIPGQGMAATISDHAAALADTIVIDAANRVGSATLNSLADFQCHAPSAQVFRAFNTLGWENFAAPRFASLQADLFYCGPDGAARGSIEQLIADVGLRPIWLGGSEQTELIDALAKVWFSLAIGQRRGRHLALKLLTDDT
jgi:hypothetical protein